MSPRDSAQDDEVGNARAREPPSHPQIGVNTILNDCLCNQLVSVQHPPLQKLESTQINQRARAEKEKSASWRTGVGVSASCFLSTQLFCVEVFLIESGICVSGLSVFYFSGFP